MFTAYTHVVWKLWSQENFAGRTYRLTDGRPYRWANVHTDGQGDSSIPPPPLRFWYLVSCAGLTPL